jgi:hypothetical protein
MSSAASGSEAEEGEAQRQEKLLGYLNSLWKTLRQYAGTAKRTMVLASVLLLASLVWPVAAASALVSHLSLS